VVIVPIASAKAWDVGNLSTAKQSHSMNIKENKYVGYV